MTTDLTLATLLDQTAAVIADPAHWTQGAFARDAQGKGCDPHDPEAVAWCLIGALHKVTHHENVIVAMRWLRTTITIAPNPIWFNDHATHADVLAALAQARNAALASTQETDDATDDPTDDE